MAREKIQMKKIENTTSRQVALSKRRRGLFKKARELSILCEAHVALIIFSATGKLFEYSSSSMDMILEKYSKSTSVIQQDAQPQLKNKNHALTKINQQIEDACYLMRQMKGEELEGLSIEDLQQLEEKLEIGLGHVRSKKGERLIKEIKDLQRKGFQILEENTKLRQKIRQRQGHVETYDAEERLFFGSLENQDPQSSESISTPFNSKVHKDKLQDNETSDTSLHLGLPQSKV